MPLDRLKQLLSFLKESPNDPFLLFALAKEYEKAEDREQALAYYLKLKNEQSDYVGTYYHLGKLYENSGQFDLAISTYQAGMEVAEKAGDRHAWSELSGAKWEIEEE